VLDRITGEFISAQPFSRVSWAKGIDPKTGRPIRNAESGRHQPGSRDNAAEADAVGVWARWQGRAAQIRSRARTTRFFDCRSPMWQVM